LDEFGQNCNILVEGSLSKFGILFQCLSITLAIFRDILFKFLRLFEISRKQIGLGWGLSFDLLRNSFDHVFDAELAFFLGRLGRSHNINLDE
jgi:hypothetical protein